MKDASVIQVQSSDVQLGESFPAFVEERIRSIAKRYLDRLTEADVHVRREGAAFVCSVRLKVSSLPTFAASETDFDIYRSVALATEKVAKQLRRRKRELREDKAERADKLMAIEDGLRAIPEPAEEPTELDDYEKALLQAARQGQPSLQRISAQAAE